MNTEEIYENYIYARQRFCRLLEFISELQAVWDDTVAHSIRSKALEPYQDEGEQMLKAFKKQCDAFQQIMLKLLDLEKYKQNFYEFNEAMNQEQNYAQMELNELEYMNKQFLYYNAITQYCLADAYQSIKNAREAIQLYR